VVFAEGERKYDFDVCHGSSFLPRGVDGVPDFLGFKALKVCGAKNSKKRVSRALGAF